MMRRRALRKRYGRSASAVRIYMGHEGEATKVIDKFADGWYYRLWRSEPWVGPFDNKGYAAYRRDMALRGGGK